MHRRHSSFRRAFTLIEVMVAVMIVSIVIAALLQMRGDTSNKLFQLKEMMQTNQYNSFLLSNSEKYAFEDSKIDMK
ncbi:MAG: type II secretion system protein, partial [Campylobacterota bacterium]|nr:type II secretion system protein [Campylobacterota bacterium]